MFPRRVGPTHPVYRCTFTLPPQGRGGNKGRFFWLLFLLVFAVCAGAGGHDGGARPYSIRLDAPSDGVWEAGMRMFADRQVKLEEADRARGKMVTQWLYREGERRMGVGGRGRWTERYKLTLQVSRKGEATEVSAHAIVEEKSPGGTQAYRWQRVRSTGDLEREALEAVRRAVGPASGKAAKGATR